MTATKDYTIEEQCKDYPARARMSGAELTPFMYGDLKYDLLKQEYKLIHTAYLAEEEWDSYMELYYYIKAVNDLLVDIENKQGKERADELFELCINYARDEGGLYEYDKTPYILAEIINNLKEASNERKS